MKTLLIITNVDWFLISHRLVLAKAAIRDGWKVYVACEDTGRSGEIGVEGIKFINFPLSRSGTNPFDEYKLYQRFKRLYSDVKPDVVHQITIKPVVYGSIAAQKVGVPGIVNAISGMGYMFTDGKIGLLQRVILYLMRNGSNRKNVSYIFQNEEDMAVLNEFKITDQCKSINLIRGSGIDLDVYSFSELPPVDEKIRILFPSRMLWDKGVKELKEATELLKENYRNKIQFVLVGMADDHNKSAVSSDFLKGWEEDDYVIWKGYCKNMIEMYRDSHIVILPSYREGLPKTLIEACAIGRPIITTDAIGCKDCVDEGINGFKVPIKNSRELADSLEKLIVNRDLMVKMGVEGRKKAEREFNIKDVISKHLEIYNSFV